MKRSRMWIALAAIGLLILLVATIKLIPVQTSQLWTTVGSITGAILGFLAAAAGVLFSLRKKGLEEQSFDPKQVKKAEWSKVVTFLLGYGMVIVGFVLAMIPSQQMDRPRFEILLVGIILCGIGGGSLIGEVLGKYRK